jgi:hypothetical protein
MDEEADRGRTTVDTEPTLDLPAVPTDLPVAPTPAARAKPARVAVTDEDEFAGLRSAMT